jgi:hypothetical protein
MPLSETASRHRPIVAAIHAGVRVAVAFLLGVSSLGAATAPMRMKVEPIIARPRSLGPTGLDIMIMCDSPKLYEGRLELTFLLGALPKPQMRVYEYRSDEMAISAGEHRLRVLLPPVPVPRESENLVIHARFVGRNGVIDFPDEYNVLLAGTHKRAFVLGVSQPTTRRPRSDGLSFVDRLPFELFNQNPETRNDWLTYPAYLPPEDLPTSSVAYCMFDVLLLEEDGLVELKQPQLNAVAEWVEAGGSLLVMVTRGVQPRHREFLNRLLAANGMPKSFMTDEQGMLIPVADDPATVVRSAPGLGRCAILTQAIDRTRFLASAEWRDTVLWLWRARHDQSAAVRAKGILDTAAPQMQRGYYRPPSFAPVALNGYERLFERLIPSRVEGVPMGTVVTLLVLFLLAAAPGDYFLLGLLRRRKYTWVLFTAVSLGFTLLTMHLAQRHMGRVDYRTHLTVVDYGNGDQPVRSTKLEMLFTATERLVETRTNDELYVSLNLRRTLGRQQNNPLAFDPGFDEIPLQTDPDLPLAEGRAMGSYLIRQQMRQWSPRFFSRTTFSPEMESLRIEWARRADESWQTPEGRRKYQQRICAGHSGAVLVFLHGKQSHIVSAAGEGPLESGDQELVTLATQITRRPEIGLFSVVSQISPNGAPGFEDLAVVDSSDLSREWVLMIVPDAQGHTIYRKSLPLSP